MFALIDAAVDLEYCDCESADRFSRSCRRRRMNTNAVTLVPQMSSATNTHTITTVVRDAESDSASDVASLVDKNGAHASLAQMTPCGRDRWAGERLS